MKALLRKLWVGPLLALVVTYLVFLVYLLVVGGTPVFAEGRAVILIVYQTAVVSVCAVGMTMVIATGGIDLSVGSLVALTTVVIALLVKGGVPESLAALLAIALATGWGALVGTYVAALRVPSFIVTLGAMGILRGAATGLAKSEMVAVRAPSLDGLAADPMSLPPSIWIALSVALFGAGLLRFTRFGRHVFAVGSNEKAARLAGVRVTRTKVLVYTSAGALTGIAGLLEFSSLTQGDPTDSVGLELPVIAAVVIGGASLNGGEGSVAGSVIGALLMTTIRYGCECVMLPSFTQQVLLGAIILVAVTLDRFRHWRGE